MSEERKFGYTFPGRYEVLDKRTGITHYDWPISEVLTSRPEIQTIISLGSSVGINENLLAATNPSKDIYLVDINRQALMLSDQGEWPYDEIRPS